MKIMNWIKNLGLTFFSATLAFVFSEALLRIDGRYSDQVSLQIQDSTTNKVWQREINTKHVRAHPDLSYDIEINFDEIGARQSDFTKQQGETIVGVFGDSFTENRRIENKYTFTEILNHASNKAHFINFGVDGYGLEQSFQNWIDKSSIVDMDIVFYLFCANDYYDTYEVQLFDKHEMAMGKVVNNVSTNVPFWIRVASKFHLTYLFLESWYALKSVSVSPDELMNLLGRRFTKDYQSLKDRQFDGYVNDLGRLLLSDNTDLTLIKEVGHFKATLLEWQNQVKKGGGKFIVLILPREIEKEYSKRLIPKAVQSINLSEFENHPSATKWSWDFNNDGHWNEYGNLTAAIYLYNHFAETKLFNEVPIPINDKFWKNYSLEIDTLYEEKGSQ